MRAVCAGREKAMLRVFSAVATNTKTSNLVFNCNCRSPGKSFLALKEQVGKPLPTRHSKYTTKDFLRESWAGYSYTLAE